jgi:HEAT repeat protein
VFESRSIAASESAVEIEPVGVDEPDELTPEPSAAEPPTAIEPVALEATEVGHFTSTLDADEARDEARRLLDGDSYDKGLAAVSDPLARNMIAAELLSALSGRNAERRARAHTAFVEHGYFNEATQKLRHAEAPVERASAARSLGLAGDRLATPDLIAALEDESMEVRRAAVEALASVRDPAAAGPLQALLERERKERFRVPRRLVEHAIEVCREAPERLAPTLADRAAAELVHAPATADPETGTAESHLFEPAAVKLPVEPAAVESAIEPYVEPSPAETMADAGPTQASLEDEEAQIEGPVAFVEEEPPTLVASDETVADAAPETVWMAEAEPVRETLAETVSEDEEPAADDAAEPAAPFAAEMHAPAEEPAPLGLEFESHHAEPAETAVVPVEGFETARDHAHAGAEDWFDVDMAEVEGAGRKAHDDLASAGDLASKEIITATPVETPEAARAPVEIEPHVSASAASAPPAPETALAINEAVDAPPGASMTREPTAIAPFGEDDLSAVPRAIQLRLGSDEPEVRAAAVKDLASVSADDAFRVICHGFDDPSVEVRSAAARSLHVLQDDRAEAFTRALREAAPQRRRNIGAAIASSGLAAEAISQLTGESREKTYDAFSLLFLMAKAGEVQPLLRAVEAHPENEVRLAVVKLLALSGQKEILPAFRRLAVRNALPSEVRAAIMEAIYQITSQPSSHHSPFTIYHLPFTVH